MPHKCNTVEQDEADAFGQDKADAARLTMDLKAQQVMDLDAPEVMDLKVPPRQGEVAPRNTTFKFLCRMLFYSL